jgi:hypothetical protein
LRGYDKSKCPCCDATDDFTTIEGYASMKVAVKNISNPGNILIEKERKSKNQWTDNFQRSV